MGVGDGNDLFIQLIMNIFFVDFCILKSYHILNFLCGTNDLWKQSV